MSENLYRQLIDIYESPINVYDKELRLIFMNQKSAEILGGKPEDFIGKKITEYFLSPIAEDLMEKQRKIIETGQAADFEILIEYSGNKIWYWSHIQPVKDKEGNVSMLMLISYDITERKKAEKKLRHAENLINHAQQLAHLGSYEWDIVNNRVERSDEVYRIFGVTRDELGSKYRMIQLVHPDDRDNMEKRFQLVKSGYIVEPYEFRIIRPDGNQRFLYANEVTTFDDSGVPIKSIGCLLDITERKKAEEKLRRSDYLLNRAQELAHLGSFETDLANNTFERSDELYRIFGITRDEVATEERMSQWVHPDDRVIVEKGYQDTVAGINVGPQEFRIIRPDGQERFVFTNRDIIFDDSGVPIKALGFLQDITERKRAEEKIRRSENLLKQTQKLAHLGSYEFDMINYHFERTDELYRIFGFNRDEVDSDERIIKNIHPDDRDNVEKLFDLSLTGNNPGLIEFRIIRPDGEERFVSANAEMMLDDKGVPIKRIGYILDITELKKVEGKLLRSEYLLNQAQQLAHLGSYELDIINKRYERSDELYRIFGITREEVTPEERFTQWIHPDDRDNMEKGYQSMEAGHSIGPKEFRIIRPDGEERVVFANEDIISDESGVPVKVIGYILDITERKKAEEEREQLILELKQALNNIKTLKGLLPICSNCKKIRTDKGYWSQIEVYIQTHTDALFTHSICPVCVEKLYGDEDWHKEIHNK